MGSVLALQRFHPDVTSALQDWQGIPQETRRTGERVNNGLAQRRQGREEPHSFFTGPFLRGEWAAVLKGLAAVFSLARITKNRR
jgi:hypothetical protein